MIQMEDRAAYFPFAEDFHFTPAQLNSVVLTA